MSIPGCGHRTFQLDQRGPQLWRAFFEEDVERLKPNGFETRTRFRQFRVRLRCTVQVNCAALQTVSPVHLGGSAGHNERNIAEGCDCIAKFDRARKTSGPSSTFLPRARSLKPFTVACVEDFSNWGVSKTKITGIAEASTYPFMGIASPLPGIYREVRPATAVTHAKARFSSRRQRNDTADCQNYYRDANSIRRSRSGRRR
jgi:hypothetical protein